MSTLLIIEDNRDVNHLIRETLAREGYKVISAFDGLTGSKMLAAGDFDLVILDLMLPFKSGDEIVKELRGFSDVPVIILSAKDTVFTKIDLLKLGADDYMTKPFDLGELAARAAAQLRRYHRAEKAEEIYTYKDMQLDSKIKRVLVNGREADLTAKEYYILELMLQNRDKVFSKANLYESIWKEEYLGDDNAVKTHISNLRSKLKKCNPSADYIETVWGLGYRLCKETDIAKN